MPLKVAFSWLTLLSYSKSNLGCLSPAESPLWVGGSPFSPRLLEGGFGHCYFCVGKSSPADAQKCCGWAVIHSSPLQSCPKVFAGLLQCQDPQEAVLQVQLTPASLWIPVQGRLKWVWAGMQAGSGGFELVFAGCLRFCGNAFLKLLCCNADSGNLDGSTEYLLCVPGWMTMCWWGYLYQLGLRRRRRIITEIAMSDLC